MAHTLSSQQDHFQSEGYSSLYNRTPNPLSAHQSSLHTCNGSMPCLSGLESPLVISSCSSSYLSVGSPSAWQLSNPAFLSCSKNVDIPTGLVDLELQIPHETANHVQSSSSDFATNKLDNVGWQIFLEPTMSLISPNTSLLPVSVSTGSPVEGAILTQLLGRLENNNCSDCVSPPGTTLAGGSAQHLGSAMRNGGCLWNQVDASTDMGLAVDSAKGDFLHHGLGLANSQCMIQFSLDPGFTDHAVSFPSFANVDQTCHPFSSDVTGGMNLSLEASQSLEKSNANKFLMTSNYTTQQNSPKIHCNLASTKFHFGQNAKKVAIPHDVKNGETATQDDSDRMSYIPASFHLVVAMDEAKLLQNGASPANSSSSIHKELIETQRKKRQKSISEEKVKDDSCLSETSKKKMDEAKFKRQKSLEQSQVKEEPKLKVEKSSSENSDKSVKENPKPPEPPKRDYIHVRARRGQATDSHSLAERVRREKISERMKFLQDLVPGCNKVTGKALMLDEIINYVQSLQRQVEFLSMKLAAVNPRLDFNIESLLTKQQMLSSACPTPTSMLSPADHANLLQLHATQQNAIQLGLSCGLDLTSSGNELNATLRRSMISPVAVDTYANSGFQTSSVWDELHNVVQLGFVSDHLSMGQMKVEL